MFERRSSVKAAALRPFAFFGSRLHQRVDGARKRWVAPVNRGRVFDCPLRDRHDLLGNPLRFLLMPVVCRADGKLSLDTENPALCRQSLALNQFGDSAVPQNTLQLKNLVMTGEAFRPWNGTWFRRVQIGASRGFVISHLVFLKRRYQEPFCVAFSNLLIFQMAAGLASRSSVRQPAA